MAKPEAFRKHSGSAFGQEVSLSSKKTQIALPLGKKIFERKQVAAFTPRQSNEVHDRGRDLKCTARDPLALSSSRLSTVQPASKEKLAPQADVDRPF
jgi:hypothetical protein